MIVLIDNYDSFCYNLYQLVGTLYEDIKVIRNDAFTVEGIQRLKPSGIILSPGPGRPENAGICIETIQKLYKKIPILGVCLGHQAIWEAFGGKVSYAKKLMHGKTSMIKLDTKSQLFYGMKQLIQVARYHSLSAVKETLPEVFNITAQTQEGEIMAIEHKTAKVYGLQFHPESVMTPEGDVLIKHFLEVVKND